MNTRAKGQRTFAKAMAYATLHFPTGVFLPLYQPSRFSKPQPFDLMILEPFEPPICVEVRSNQWGVSKPQTRRLAHLPGHIRKQIWLFKNGATTPQIRRWSHETWS